VRSTNKHSDIGPSAISPVESMREQISRRSLVAKWTGYVAVSLHVLRSTDKYGTLEIWGGGSGPWNG